MTFASNPSPHAVIYDPDAVAEFVTAVKSKEEQKGIINAVLKLRELGERLEPPHMKPLQGAAGLRELRPKQGRSDWRAVYCRCGVIYVIVAVDRQKNFAAMIERAWTRASRYGAMSLNFDKS